MSKYPDPVGRCRQAGFWACVKVKLKTRTEWKWKKYKDIVKAAQAAAKPDPTTMSERLYWGDDYYQQ